MLGDVVRKEKPEIEEKKGRLVNNMAKDKKQLKSLEERILQTLSDATGSVLDNQVCFRCVFFAFLVRI